MAYITIDFGSSNSGAVLNTALGKTYNQSELIYVHRQDGDAGFTKQPTVFWVKRSLLDKTEITENDINVFSCVFHEEEKYASKANFIWCNNQIKKQLPNIINNREWVRIQHPKMELYRSGNQNPAFVKIRANDGSMWSLSKIIRLFFLIIKKECMHKAAEAGVIMASDDISWNITVPGMAIWNQNAVKVIKDIATPIFGENLTLLSEPECALIGINISGSSELDFVKDRYSLVVDLGGGTADICVMKETMNADGSKTFDEIKSTFEGKDSTTSEHAGGNDIDRNFKAFFCNYLAEGIDLADSPVLLYTEFLKENPVGAMEFDKKWIELQFSDEIEEDTISFFPGRYYIEWLRTHYPAAANKRGEYGFSLNGEKMREYVFTPVYKIILKSLEENLIVLKQKGFELDAIYHAGGLSLDKRLKKQIKTMISTYFPYAKHKETSDGSVIGAVQRGGNHIAVNKDTLIRRMSRKTYYTEFVTKYPGNMDELRSIIGSQLRHDYDQLGIYLNDDEISNIINRQWSNVAIDYSDGCVPYLTPMCIRFTPVTQVQSFEIKPFKPGHQTGVTVRVFSSDKNFVLFMNSDVQDEGEFSHEFGYNWDKAKLVFDPASNAVEGTALFSLLSENDTKLEEFEIRNVSKRGI